MSNNIVKRCDLTSFFIILFIIYLNVSDSSQIVSSMDRVHIIGGGPVGYSMALTLAKRKIPCVIYEKSKEIRYDMAESYPIGVNQRGLRTLRDIGGESLVNAVAENGYVKSWKIAKRGIKIVR